MKKIAKIKIGEFVKFWGYVSKWDYENAGLRSGDLYEVTSINNRLVGIRVKDREVLVSPDKIRLVEQKGL